MDSETRLHIETMKNSATNGRWFCAILSALCMTTGVVRDDRSFAIMALLAAASIGIACLSDRLPSTRAGMAFSLIATVLPAVVAVVFLFSVW